jgi:hypothetical protein
LKKLKTIDAALSHHDKKDTTTNRAKMSFTEKLHADNDATTYYHLFDMNCALVISLLKLNTTINRARPLTK